MTAKNVAQLFKKEDRHHIWSSLWYGILKQQAAEDLVEWLLKGMTELGEEVVDIGQENLISFKEIIKNPLQYKSFVVLELKKAFDQEYAAAADQERGYI